MLSASSLTIMFRQMVGMPCPTPSVVFRYVHTGMALEDLDSALYAAKLARQQARGPRDAAKQAMQSALTALGLGGPQRPGPRSHPSTPPTPPTPAQLQAAIAAFQAADATFQAADAAVKTAQAAFSAACKSATVT